MAAVIFWDVDTQRDFVLPDGDLYVPGAERLAANLGRLTTFARDERIPIVASVDDHDPGDDEISDDPDFERTFPPHCMRGTPGALKVEETRMRDPVIVPWEARDPARVREDVLAHAGEILIRKKEFDVFQNPNTPAVIDALAPDHVVLYGVALDVCDRFAIEGLLRRGGLTVHLVTDAVQALRRERSQELIDGWVARGVRTVDTGGIVDGAYLDPLR